MLGEVFFVIIIILVEKKVEQVIRFEGNICMYWELLQKKTVFAFSTHLMIRIFKNPIIVII